MPATSGFERPSGSASRSPATRRSGRSRSALACERQLAGIEDGPFRHVRPARRLRPEGCVAFVDTARHWIFLSDLGHHVLADLAERAQQSVVELADFDRLVLLQLLQALCIGGVELRQRSRVLAGGVHRNETSLFGSQRNPLTLV